MQKVFSIIICTILGLSTLFFGGTTLYYRNELGKSVSELGRVRAELAAATDQQQELRELVGDSKSILEQSVTTVSGLREQIRELERSYKKMEDLLWNNSGSNSSNDSGAGDNTGE